MPPSNVHELAAFSKELCQHIQLERLTMTEKVSAEDTALTSSDTVQPTDSRSAEGMKMVRPDPSEFRTLHGDAYFTASGFSIKDDAISRRMLDPRSVQLPKVIKGCLCGCALLPLTFLFFILFGAIMAKIIGWLLVLSLIPCIYLMLQTHLFIRAAQQLPGTVVSYREHQDSESGTMYALNVEYRDQNGEKYTFNSSLYSNSPSKNIGDSVIVLRHRYGSEAKLFLFEDTFMIYWIWLCVGICVGGCLFGQYLLEWLYM